MCDQFDEARDNPGRFYAAAAESMRRILIEHARRRGRQKRGGDLKKLSLDHEVAAAEAIGISERTARREWMFARAWLFDALNA